MIQRDAPDGVGYLSYDEEDDMGRAERERLYNYIVGVAGQGDVRDAVHAVQLPPEYEDAALAYAANALRTASAAAELRSEEDMLRRAARYLDHLRDAP